MEGREGREDKKEKGKIRVSRIRDRFLKHTYLLSFAFLLVLYKGKLIISPRSCASSLIFNILFSRTSVLKVYSREPWGGIFESKLFSILEDSSGQNYFRNNKKSQFAFFTQSSFPEATWLCDDIIA